MPSNSAFARGMWNADVTTATRRQPAGMAWIVSAK
jgi:hypothetical protein